MVVKKTPPLLLPCIKALNSALLSTLFILSSPIKLLAYLDQKVKVTSKGVKKTFGFAKYLHDSLPNATFVGFTGTPIDATLDVFGKVVDSYTMTESVRDEITVRIVYEGRAAKVALHNSELEKIEKYYEEAAEEGAKVASMGVPVKPTKVALGSESCRYLAKPNVFLTPFEVTFTFWSKLVWLLWASSERIREN
jgi:hypothetical protein